MNTIRFTRIKQLWIQQTIYNKRSLMSNGLGLLCGLYMIHFIGIVSDSTITFYSAFFALSFCIFMAKYMSETFAAMNTKEKRISFLSFPATTQEKFIAYTSWHVVVPIVLFMAAYLLSELPRAATVFSMERFPLEKDIILLPRLYENIIVWLMAYKNSAMAELMYMTSAFAFSASLFLLGSCLWYKKVFLKTVAAIGVTVFLGIVLTWVSIDFLRECGMNYDTINKIFFFTDPDRFGLWVQFIPMNIGTVIVWVVCYHLFKHREVISQKHNWLSRFRLIK